MKKSNLIIVVIAFVIGIAIFWKSYIFGLIPFPGDYLLSWYEPWKTYFTANGVPILPHKAILDDVFRQLYQYKIITAESMRNGHLPLWNPYNGSGMPLMAVMHAGFFTPLVGLFVALPGWLAWTIYIVIQPIFLSIGMLWYGRKIGLSWVASIFASIVYATSGFITVRYLFGEYVYVAACLPILLGIIETYRENKKTKSIWSIPLIILFMIVSGQPQMILYVLIVFVAYALFRLKETKKSYVAIGVLCLTGFLLSAIQLVPTIELYIQANMVPSSSFFVTEKFLLPVFQLVSIIIPNYFGNSATYNYWGVGDYAETAASVGSVALLFSGFSLLSGKKNEIRTFFLMVAGLTVLLVVRSPLTEWLYRLPIAIISTGVPTRIFFLTTFSVCILSGLGLDYYLRNVRMHLGRIWMGLVLFAILTCAFVGWLYVGTKGQMPAVRNSLFEAGLLLFAILVLLYLRNSKSKKYVYPLILFIIIVQFAVGLYNSTKFLPFSSRTTIFPNTQIIDQLRSIASFDRVMGLGSAVVQPNIATGLHIYDPNYYDPLYIKRYGELIAYANLGSVPDVLPRSDVVINNDVLPKQDVNQRRERLFQLLSVRYLLFHTEDNNFSIQENIQALPRVYLVKNYEKISEDNELLNRLFDPLFDPTTSVLVEQDIPLTKTVDRTKNEKAKITSYKPNHAEIQVSAVSPAILVFTDTYYRGWKAYVDGMDTPIYRVNYSLRAIIVSQGNHVVQFIYEPLSITTGTYISLISGLFYISFLIYTFRKKPVH